MSNPEHTERNKVVLGKPRIGWGDIWKEIISRRCVYERCVEEE